jgi:hypothetical protein
MEISLGWPMQNNFFNTKIASQNILAIFKDYGFKTNENVILNVLLMTI